MSTEQALLLGLIGLMLGIMLFFAAAVAPTVFRTLPAEHAGSYLRGIFPVYYAWGIVLALLSTILAYHVNIMVFMYLCVVALLFIFSRQALLPKINIARDARQAGDPAGTRDFKRLHRVSVLINLGNMLLLAISASTILWDLQVIEL